VSRKRRPRTNGQASACDGEVGYGRPPRASQFARGQSGNPRGRPKGSKNESTILSEILNRKIETRTGTGHPQRISVLEGILLRIAENSLKGDTKSAAFLLNRFAALVSGELQAPDLTADDREILEAFARRVQIKSKTSEDNDETQ
jgi:hypothetical protein